MINELAKQIHENAIAKGFYERERNIGEMLALIHSEVSEALEADRAGLHEKYNIASFLEVQPDETWKVNYETSFKSTFGAELADIIIRVLDLAEYKGLNMEAHIKAKTRYNSMREKYHGKKY